MSVCSEVGISVQVHPRTIVNIVYRHVRVCKVVDVCEVSIQCPYTDVTQCKQVHIFTEKWRGISIIWRPP